MDAIKKKALVKMSLSIRDTMKLFDQFGIGIALALDQNERLKGTVTDGDIRRAILRGVDLNEPVSKIMNPNPRTVTPATDSQDIRRLFLEATLKHMPVVDQEGRVLDIITISDLLSVPLSNPDITDREIKAVLDVLRTNDLSLGPKVIEFEKKIAAYTQRQFAVTVNRILKAIAPRVPQKIAHLRSFSGKW